MKTTLVILTSLLLALSASAGDRSVNLYSGTTAQSPVKRGCTQVTFDLVGYSGVIGNATFSNITTILTVQANQAGDVLGAISYTVTGGTLIIIEVK